MPKEGEQRNEGGGVRYASLHLGSLPLLQGYNPTHFNIHGKITCLAYTNIPDL